MNFLKMYGVRSHRLKVIYNGKDWSGYTVQSKAAFSKPLRLLCIGRLSHRKGQDLIIEAAKSDLLKRIPVELRLVGDAYTFGSAYVQSLQASVNELRKRGGRVTFEGFQVSVRANLDWADILVVPSRVEPFGTVAVEGQAAGRLVISSDAGGLTEIVIDGETGLTFPTGDASALACAISWAAEHVEESLRIARRAQGAANENFSLPRYELQLRSAFCELAGN